MRDDVEPFVTLRRQCTRWGHDHVEAIRSTDPAQPPGLNDRAADNWQPLCAIAEVAGGDWPARVQQTIATLTAADGDNEGLGVLLLKDMQQVFKEQMAKDQKADAISSAALAEQLHAMEERPWLEYGRGTDRKPISKGQIARLLSPFEIRPKTIRVGNATPKGYALDACQDAFQRYLSSPSPPSENATPQQPNNDAAKHEKLSATNTPNVADKKSQNPAPILTCGGVADWNGGIAGNKEMHAALPSSVGTPGVPLAYSTKSGQRLPCATCGGNERWQDGTVWRCVRCWPPAQQGRV